MSSFNPPRPLSTSVLERLPPRRLAEKSKGKHAKYASQNPSERVSFPARLKEVLQSFLIHY